MSVGICPRGDVQGEMCYTQSSDNGRLAKKATVMSD